MAKLEEIPGTVNLKNMCLPLVTSLFFFFLSQSSSSYDAVGPDTETRRERHQYCHCWFCRTWWFHQHCHKAQLHLWWRRSQYLIVSLRVSMNKIEQTHCLGILSISILIFLFWVSEGIRAESGWVKGKIHEFSDYYGILHYYKYFISHLMSKIYC